MSNVFDNLTRITGFQILTSNPRSGRFSNEFHNGTLKHNEKVYYFKFHHEFDDGNVYIVYENNNSIFYFSMYNDFDGEVDGPLVFEESIEQYKEEK